MSITVVGSVAYDSIETPAGRRERCLGGAATYFSLSASFFCDVRKRSPVLMGAMFLLLVVGGVAHSQACGSGKSRQARTASLRQSGIAVLKAIAQKNTEGLLGYVDSSGIAFGPDKTTLSRADLRNQFTQREGAYCLFFSTACIPKMGRFKGLESDEFLSRWKISYFEWLILNKSHSIDVELEDDDGIRGCRGYFNADAGREMENAPSSIEFDFTFYKGRWWLVGTVAGVP